MVKTFFSENFMLHGLFLAAGTVLCFVSVITPAVALLMGIGGALFFRKKEQVRTPLPTSLILKIAIVLMGFGMSWTEVAASSMSGLSLTAATVFIMLILGLLIGKMVGADKKVTLLISVGTAICGGSAIAAVAPIIQPKEEQLAFSLVVIFALNAVALLIFPPIGDYLNLSQETFGKWAAIAIHDTSSVIGAGEAYGSQALKVATTLKLTRALWIIPTTLMVSVFSANKGLKNASVPWFIFLFVGAMIIVHLIPAWNPIFEGLEFLGRRGMVVVLFYTGGSFSLAQIRKAGAKPFFLGLILWITVSIFSLWFFTST